MSQHRISAVVDGDTLNEMKADGRYRDIKSVELLSPADPYERCYKVWDFMVAFGIKHQRENITRAEIIGISKFTLTTAQVDSELRQLLCDRDIHRIGHGRYTGAYYPQEEPA